MKKIIAIVTVLICLSNYSAAQGNLQFNQVVNGSFDQFLPYTVTTIGSITVPAGKVWKIESTNYTYESSPGVDYLLNEVVYIGSNIGFVISNSVDHGLPLWLSEGTYPITGEGNNSNCEFTYSAIEFNIIP